MLINSFNRHFLIKEFEAQQIKEDEVQVKKDFDIDFEKCRKINEEWNSSIIPIREARIQAEKKLAQDIVMQRMIAHQENLRQKQNTSEQIIRAEKVIVNFFVAIKFNISVVFQFLDQIV